MTGNVLIHVEDLHKKFGKLDVLNGITEDIHEGEVLSIIGPSGGGKSTFLRCLNLLEKPTSGRIFFEGADLTAKKFYDFKAMGSIMSLPVLLFLVSVVLASFSTMGYDNAFNYYIKDVLAFPSSYNGFIKATTGTLGLIANFTLNLWLIRRFAPQNTLLVLFPCCAVSLLITAQMKSVVPFLGACIVFYFFNSVYLPIQQTMMTQIQTENTGLLSGMFNAAKSLGNFVGPLFMSFVYARGTLLPFYFACGGFVLTTLVLLVHRKVSAREQQGKEQHLPVG